MPSFTTTICRRATIAGLTAVFPLLAFAGTAARAQSSLDIPLETGQNPMPVAAAPKPAPAKPAKGKANAGRLTSLPLPSRGGNSRTPVRTGPQTAPKVLAQLGLVTVDRIEVRVSREETAQPLSVVPKGTYLAVVKEDGDFWGVLMVNNTVGWVPKTALEMVDYRTEVALAPEAPKPANTASSNSNSLTEGLDPTRQSILKEAFTYLGVPYVWAGNTRSGLDCSAFVKGVFSTVGVNLPRVSADQATVGIPIQGPDLRPGDRLYFDMKHVGRVTHTGIYLGNGLFIHASSNQGKVGVDSIFKKNYYNALVAARRDFE